MPSLNRPPRPPRPTQGGLGELPPRFQGPAPPPQTGLKKPASALLPRLTNQPMNPNQRQYGRRRM